MIFFPLQRLTSLCNFSVLSKSRQFPFTTSCISCIDRLLSTKRCCLHFTEAFYTHSIVLTVLACEDVSIRVAVILPVEASIGEVISTSATLVRTAQQEEELAGIEHVHLNKQVILELDEGHCEIEEEKPYR